MFDSCYKIVAYIPETHVESVKAAMFLAGAGHFGNYSHCSWQVLGVGQFLPLQGANPTLGRIGETEIVPEWRVEMAVSKDRLTAVLQAYKAAHPYEAPVYDVYQMLNLADIDSNEP